MTIRSWRLGRDDRLYGMDAGGKRQAMIDREDGWHVLYRRTAWDGLPADWELVDHFKSTEDAKESFKVSEG